MCTEICAKPLKALLSEGVSLWQLILVLIAAVASFCQPPNPSLSSSNFKAINKYTNKKIHPKTPPGPNLTTSSALWLDLVCWNRFAKGLSILQPAEWMSIQWLTDYHGLCPTAPVPGLWQMLKRMCFKAYNLQSLVKLRSPWPLEDQHVCFSKPRELHFSGTHVRCQTHCISLHHLSGCQGSQTKIQHRRQQLNPLFYPPTHLPHHFKASLDHPGPHSSSPWGFKKWVLAERLEAP